MRSHFLYFAGFAELKQHFCLLGSIYALRAQPPPHRHHPTTTALVTPPDIVQRSPTITGEKRGVSLVTWNNSQTVVTCPPTHPAAWLNRSRWLHVLRWIRQCSRTGSVPELRCFWAPVVIVTSMFGCCENILIVYLWSYTLKQWSQTAPALIIFHVIICWIRALGLHIIFI